MKQELQGVIKPESPETVVRAECKAYGGGYASVSVPMLSVPKLSKLS